MAKQNQGRDIPARQGQNLPNQPPSEDLIKQFLELQGQEIAIRKDELALETKREQQNHEFAKASLTATAEDRTQIRSHVAGESTKRYLFVGFCLLCLIGVIIFLVANGQAEIAVEILKGLAYIIVGGLGGYSLRRTQEGRSDGPE